MAKVIASSVRKGNVLEIDGKLCVVLKAENIHPGKGTPVTHLEMRRIADGVKVTERYRTTEQVERAYLEERELNYLYEDESGYTFMHPETYDQITVPKDIVGDQAVYLQEGMTVTIVTHEINFARKAADRIVFMEHGKIVEQGAAEDLFNNPQHERTARFLNQLSA